MAIRNKTGERPTITEGWRALDLFTDRVHLIRHFANYLHADPPAEQILFFHGDGGNGKSLLLRYLREKCCHTLTPDNWAYLDAIADDAEFAAQFAAAEGATDIPYAHLDFGLQPQGHDRPQEGWFALLELRRDLATFDLRFPLYDFACLWYLHQTHQLEQYKTLLPEKEVDLLSEVINFGTQTSWGAMGKAVINLFDKHLAEKRTLYLSRRRLTEADIEAIQRMEPRTELLQALPELFAQDLNVALTLPGAPPRLALFFDTHEAFWGDHRAAADARYFERDEWLRTLLVNLEFTHGLIVVVAGRERPRWSAATIAAIPDDAVDTQLLGHLHPLDARDYLTRAAITDATLQETLIAYASVEPDQVHPLFLGLCADIVLAATERGTPVTPDDFGDSPDVDQKGARLIARLLRYLDQGTEDAVRALAACRAFDRALFDALGGTLNFAHTDAAFTQLTRFSFVWPVDSPGAPRYRLHALLRRLLREQVGPTLRAADEALEAHYRQRVTDGDATAIVEAIYHANQQDWARGADEWIDCFDCALTYSRYQQCEALLEVRSDLNLVSDFYVARIAQSAAEYFSVLSRQDEAAQEFMLAIERYDRSLILAPNDHHVHNNKGNALKNLGDLQAKFANQTAALSFYVQAISSFDQALAISLDYRYMINKGNTLQALGTLQARLTNYTEAFSSYAQAIASYDYALSFAPDDSYAHNNKGVVLQGLGELQVRLSEYDAARNSYANAVVSYNHALSITPDAASALNNKGITLAHLGIIQAQANDYAEANISYDQAIISFDQALSLAPDDTRALSNKGNTQQAIGALQALSNDCVAARISYTQAVITYDRVLALALNDTHAYNNRGNTFRALGALQVQLLDYTAACSCYSQAIASYEHALALAPDDSFAHNNKGVALQGLGELHSRLLEYDSACRSYTLAIASYDQALALAPKDAVFLSNKGNVLREFGELLCQFHDPQRASRCWHAALVVLDQSLSLAPGNVKVRALRSEVQHLLDVPNETSS